jgi:hypothetical protein
VKAVNKIIFPGLFVLLFLPWVANAQSKNIPLLERVVTVSISNETVDVALKKVGQAGGFSFSYKSSIIQETEKVSYQGVNVIVREVLDHILKGSYNYREKGNHIILTRGEKETSRNSKVIDGYVVDDATGRRLKNVSVYDPATLSSAVTDSYGYFRLEIKNPSDEEIRLAINKNTYIDTVVVVPRSWKTLIRVPIKENARKLGTIADTVGHRIKKIWLDVRESSSQEANLENITDTLHRTYQFGVFPFVGSNGKLSGNVVNDYSFNLIGGYSYGNNKIEMAGIFNANRSNVHGFQLAGLANGVAGTQDGVQVAGWLNFVMDSVKGVQVAGFANVDLRNAGPVQLAGLTNVSIGPVEGVQASGLVNLATDNVEGFQLAGVMNIAAEGIHGAQVGLINYSGETNGFQLGLLNYSSRMNGIPIGLISIVGDGYHKIEFSADEIFYFNAAFRTGVRNFYNIIGAGVMPHTFDQQQTTWSFGYGIGTAPRLSQKIFLNIDLTSNQIVMGPIEEINLLNKLYVGLDFQVAKTFSITAGVTLNGLVKDDTYEGYPDLFSQYQPEIIYEKKFDNNLLLQSWLGAKIGIRFL